MISLFWGLLLLLLRPPSGLSFCPSNSIQRVRAPSCGKPIHYISRFDQWFEKASQLKCPFFKRRAVDVLDGAAQISNFLYSRHKKLQVIPPGCASEGEKNTGLSLSHLATIVEKDWKTDSDKGYYVTGLPTKSIYRDDCIFDGPDPDMPVRGLKKFTGASKHLFDKKLSFAHLHSVSIDENANCITATWTINAVLNLPWRPKVGPLDGETVYQIDDSGLIGSHTETWNIGMVQAFLETLVPALRTAKNH
jgi:hypothetical protein